MHTIIDGIIYELQSRGGISRLYNEILPRMCDFDDSLRITLLASRMRKQTLPTHARIRERRLCPIEQLLRPGRLWGPIHSRARELTRQLAVGKTRSGIWHSTYYTTLPGWPGPAVVTVVDMIHERYADHFNGPQDRDLRWRKRLCTTNADAVICISQTTRQDVLRYYELDEAETYVVPLAPSEAFRLLEHRLDLPLTPSEKPFLLYVGDRRAYHKNFRTLLWSYSHWSLQEEMDLIVVGEPWTRNEKSELAQAGISEQAYVLSDIDDERLCRLYNHATAFVYPSLYEGFGVPLLEAMACGCPIIASRIPSTVEIAGNCPSYFDPLECDDLIRALDQVATEGRDSERVELGLAQVRQFSWDQTARQTLDVYRGLSRTE